MNLSTFVRDFKAIWYFDNHWQLLLERASELVFGRTLSLSIYRKHGFEILMDKDSGDQSGARYAITSLMYRQFLQYIREKTPQAALTQGVKVWDIGANVGGFSLMLALEKIVFARLVAVEMHPRTFVRLQQNLQHNFRSLQAQGHLHCINAAAGDREETLQLSLSQGNTGDSIIEGHLPTKTNEAEYTVRVTSLESLYNATFKGEIIDICKMDIEGAEYEIFLGKHHDPLKRCRFVVIEIHPHPQYPTSIVHDGFAKLGFKKVHIEHPAEEDVFLFENSAL